MLKLLYYAKCRDVTVIRIGTSGGLGKVYSKHVTFTDDGIHQNVLIFFVLIR